VFHFDFYKGNVFWSKVYVVLSRIQNDFEIVN